jgi:hypothetical protein
MNISNPNSCLYFPNYTTLADIEMVGGFDRKDLNRGKDMVVMILTARPSLFIPPGRTKTDAYTKLVASPKTVCPKLTNILVGHPGVPISNLTNKDQLTDLINNITNTCTLMHTDICTNTKKRPTKQ